MSETEQAEAALRMALALPDVAAMIANDARENLGGTEVVSVGSVFAREIEGVMCTRSSPTVPGHQRHLTRRLLDWRSHTPRLVHPILPALPDVAAMISKDARENFGGLDVVSVGSVFAREIQGVQCYLVVAIVPDRDGRDFVPSEVILDTAQNYLAASVNRLALIASLEELSTRVQIFGNELTLAKYCQKEWPNESMDQAVAEMMRGLN